MVTPEVNSAIVSSRTFAVVVAKLDQAAAVAEAMPPSNAALSLSRVGKERQGRKTPNRRSMIPPGTQIAKGWCGERKVALCRRGVGRSPDS